MKKLAFIISIFLVALLSPTQLAFAATSTNSGSTPTAAVATASGLTEPKNAKAKDLLERVATKVAELANKERRTYVGKIKSKGAKSIVITTSDGDHTVTTNDLTVFYRYKASKRSEIEFKNLLEGDDISATGTIDQSTGEMTAKQIIAKIKRIVIAGKIEKVQKSELTIKDQTGGSSVVDLTDATSLKKIDSKNQIVNAKETDFVTGATVFIIAHSQDKKTGTYSVLKGLVW